MILFITQHTITIDYQKTPSILTADLFHLDKVIIFLKIRRHKYNRVSTKSFDVMAQVDRQKANKSIFLNLLS